jgi:DNA mismatch repair ATPase MutS
LYGLQEFNQHLVDESIKQHSTIAQTIIKRDNAVVLLNNKSVNLNDLLSAIPEINRLPVLVTLNPHNAHDTLFAMHNALKNVIPTEQMSVMFRKPGNDPFNEYIKEQKLNNMVDKDTKVVYISSIKLPKPLLQADWKASCVLSFDSSKLTFNNVTNYVDGFDLRITYDEIAIGGLWDRGERRYLRANM